MSAESAHAQIPTRICPLNLDDLLVDAGRNHSVGVNGPGDGLERPLAEALGVELRSDWKMTMRPSPAVSFTSPWWFWMISKKLEKYVWTSWLSFFASSCSESFV